MSLKNVCLKLFSNNSSIYVFVFFIRVRYSDVHYISLNNTSQYDKFIYIMYWRIRFQTRKTQKISIGDLRSWQRLVKYILLINIKIKFFFRILWRSIGRKQINFFWKLHIIVNRTWFVLAVLCNMLNVVFNQLTIYWKWVVKSYIFVYQSKL